MDMGKGHIENKYFKKTAETNSIYRFLTHLPTS